MEEVKQKKQKHANGTLIRNSHKTPISIGLSNLGNTWYANAVIQALIHTKEFHEKLVSLNSQQKCRVTPTDEFWSIWYLNHIWYKGFTSDEQFLRAEEVLDIIKNVWGGSMTVGMQQDAHEFFLLLLDNLIQTWHKKCPTEKSKDKCPHPDCNELSQVFKGVMKSTITCSNCHGEREIFEAFSELKLEHDQCILGDVVFDGNNQYNCSQWNWFSDAVKRSKIWQAPPILIVGLNRFNRFGMKHKDKEITFPDKLDLTGKVVSKKRSKLAYDIHALIVHEGRFSFKGHYFTYVKGFDNKWYKCDDHKVTRVDDIDEIMSSAPYILFYRMRQSSRRYYLGKFEWEHAPSTEAELPSEPKKKPKKEKNGNGLPLKRKRNATLMKTIIRLPYICSKEF